MTVIWICEGDKRVSNRIIYYYLFEKKDQNFKDCLEAMDVEVRELQIKGNDWKDAYIDVADNIKTYIGGKNYGHI